MGLSFKPKVIQYALDLEEKIEKGQIRSVVKDKEIFRTIMYADDIVLLARREAELKEMIKRFRRFLERKGLSLSDSLLTNQR